MDLDPLERWSELDELFERALESPTEEREALLAETRETRPELGRALERLLTAHAESGAFLEDRAAVLGEAPAPSSEPAVTAPSLEGQTIAHFQILETVGSGGMGVVYKARDTHLDRLVTLKFLRPHLVADEAAKARFIQEAKAASALDHANICTIYDIAESEDGHLYMEMAYYAGETLKERLARGRPTVEESVDIARQLAHGLEQAHTAGIVHRDLKPANVMITERGEVKILDFGIAKLEGTADLTRTGLLMGTVTYMSPEQARGDRVDHRTDIWALGVVLYEMLCGSRPFRGATDHAVVYSILHEDPAPWPPECQVHEALAAVVRRALAKDPADRFGEMSDLVAAMWALPGGNAADQRSHASIGGHRARWIVAVVVVAVLVGGVRLLTRQAGPDTDPVLALPLGPTIAVVPFEDLSPGPEQQYFARGLTEDLITNLGRFSDLFVLSSAATAPYREPEPDIDAMRNDLGVEYLLLGTVRQENEQVRVNVRLLDAATRNTMWDEIYEPDLSAAGLFAAQDEITQRVAGTLGGSTGLIGRRLATETRGSRTDRIDAYRCVLRAYDYVIDHSAANHAVARDCLEGAVQLDSAYVDAWGWLAYTYAEESRHSWNRRESYEPLDRALATAQHAIRLEPANFMAQVALAVIRFDQHEVELFYDAAERAMALNPNDATWLAILGGHMVESGRSERGIAILDKARALNPNLPDWVNVDYFINAYDHRAYEEALGFALRINLPDYYRGCICQTAAYGQLGRFVEARAAYDRVIALRPDLVDEASVQRDFAQYNHTEHFLEHLFEGIRKSGVWDEG